MAVVPVCCYFGGKFIFEHGNVLGGTTRLIYLEPTCSFNTLCTMMYNVLGGNPCTDHISIWLSFTCNGRLMYTPVLDDVSLENGLGMVKHGFQSMLELFVKRDTYSYDMDIVDEVTIEFRESSEDANDNSSGEESWSGPVREEVEEEKEDVELPLPTMRVPPLKENDAPYPNPWIGVMDMDVTYRNTMLGCVRNVVERVNHRATLYPSSTDPHWLEIDTTVGRVPASSTLGGSDRRRRRVTSLVSLLRGSSQPERRAPRAASCKASAYNRDDDDFVSRTLTRFQPYRSLRCSIFHLSRHPTRSPSRPLSSLLSSPLSSPRSLSPAATLPLRGFI
ncbi:hypothetical protein H6P81_012160 [Aristolochia fimbriata]|uniref:Uncharacterized protein n=1 Tax=Aristolochia fimbriata TaxID=158543 RepID=A0AAV7EAZ4_ARIFI|nr:hypothetical protein H6P81_012160 [Aristolochia fimbriata]